MLALGVAEESVFARGVRHGVPLRRANAHRDDEQLALAGFFRQFQGGVDGVLPVAENDKSIGAVRCAALEVAHGGAQNKTEIGPAVACPAAIHLGNRVAQGVVVVRERNNQIRFAGEDDEADFVVG